MDRTNYTPVKETEQNMQSLSFDQELKVNATLPLTVNPITEQLERPFAIQGNASLSITESTVGDVTTTTLVKTINGINFTKTIAKNNVTNAVTISSWS